MIRKLLCIFLSCCGLYSGIATAAPAASLESLQTSPRIEEISFRGNYPVLSRQIRRQLSIRPGDIYEPSRIAEQITRIKDYYQRKGYFGTTVNAEPQWQPYSKGVALLFVITRGSTLRWGNITITGDNTLRPGRVRSAFPRWGNYSPRKLRQHAKKLARHLHSEGYLKARVRVTDTTINHDHGRIDLTVEVYAGPKIDISFAGNTTIPTRQLRQVLTFWREGRFDRYEIEASAAAILATYRNRGFPHARVSFERTRHSAEHTSLVFTIDEQRRQTVWGVQFSGNEAFSDSELREHVLTHASSLGSRGGLNQDILLEDIRAITAFYQRAGYLDVTVGSADVLSRKRFYDVTIPIVEGPRYHIGRISFSGNFSAPHEALMRRLAQVPGKPIVAHRFGEDKESLRLYFADHGHPYAQVTQHVSYEPDRPVVHLHYDVHEDRQVRIGNIAITGDFITSQRAITKTLTFASGDLYSNHAIAESRRLLGRLGAFRNIKLEQIGLREQRDVVDIAIQIEEERPYQIDFDLGYSTDDSITSGIKFTNNNAFGWAKRAQFSLLGGQERARAEISWIDPRLLGRDLLLTGSGYIDRTKETVFDVVEGGGNIGLFRQYHRTGFSLRYEMKRSRLLSSNTGTAASEGRRDTTSSQLTAGITFDTRNKFSQPTSGWYLFAEASLFNEIGGQRADFVKMRTGASNYLELFKGIILTQHARFGRIEKIGSVNTPITERFFLGGEDTLRGFGEDSLGPVDTSNNALGGNIRWIYNAELSAPLGSGLRVAGFFDVGSLTNGFGEITKANIRESVGVGLRYITPVGPLRAEYAFRLNRTTGEPRGRFHFTFGHIF